MEEKSKQVKHIDRPAQKAGRSSDIDVDNDDIHTLRLKLDLAIANAELEERRWIFLSRMNGFRIVFYPIVFLMFGFTIWSVYVLFMTQTASASQIETAKFIISTLVSAAVATLIGFIATHPAK